MLFRNSSIYSMFTVMRDVGDQDKRFSVSKQICVYIHKKKTTSKSYGLNAAPIWTI